MGQINYTFDPKNVYELKDLFDLLHRYYPEIPADYRKIGVPCSSDSEKDKEISKLKKEIEMHQKENEKNVARISELEQQLTEAKELSKIAKEDSERLSKQVSDMKAENDRLVSEYSEKEHKLNDELIAKLNSFKEEKEKDIASLQKQIAELVKKLAIYEPSLNGGTEEDKFFNIDGINLSETYDDSAPFMGKVNANGDAIFNFNNDKGQHQYYSQNPSKLEAFCEVSDSVDGANHIGLGEWGKGKYNRGLLVITTKAKIKLTRE